MRKLIFIIGITILSIASLVAQNVGINSTGAAPDASAGLDVSFTNKGVLIPRVNIADLSTAAPVTSPTTSLLVYNTNTTSGVGYYYWDGSRWVRLFSSIKYTGSVTAGNWYRIASNSGNRADASFTLTDQISGGGHSTLRFNAGVNYGDANGISFSLLSHSKYGTATFTKVRIIENGTYDGAYLEVYCNRTGTVNFFITDNNQSSGWTPVNWTAGSIPGGWTAHEYATDNVFVIGANDDILTISRSGNVGIGTTLPNDKLDVVGNAQVSGYLKVGNPTAPTTYSGQYSFYQYTSWMDISGWTWEDVCGGNPWNLTYSTYGDNGVDENMWLIWEDQGSRARSNLYSPWIWIPEDATSCTYTVVFTCDLENNYDGVFLEYSLNGTSWTKITSFIGGQSYPDNAAGSNTSCSGNNTQSCWNGTLGGGDKYYADFNISGDEGHWIRFRFVGMEDSSVGGYDGFKIFGFSAYGGMPSTSSFASGNIYAEKNVFAGSNVLFGDMAEYFPINSVSEPGDIISLVTTEYDMFKVSDKAYDDKVIGIHSTNPTVTINSPDRGIPVALQGRVPIKVITENGPIKIGDFLTSSSTSGTAMKADKSCFVIGRALEDYNEKGKIGKIYCLLQPNFYIYNPDKINYDKNDIIIEKNIDKKSITKSVTTQNNNTSIKKLDYYDYSTTPAIPSDKTQLYRWTPKRGVYSISKESAVMKNKTK